MLTVPFSVLYISDHKSGGFCGVEGWGEANREVCMRGGGCELDFFFFSLLYGMPAHSKERQNLEAWPASTYGHLREVPANKSLLAGTVFWPITSTY